jgi:hypothetical protein
MSQSVYLHIVARDQLGKSVPAGTQNVWRRFLCGLCHIKDSGRLFLAELV